MEINSIKELPNMVKIFAQDESLWKIIIEKIGRDVLETHKFSALIHHDAAEISDVYEMVIDGKMVIVIHAICKSKMDGHIYEQLFLGMPKGFHRCKVDNYWNYRWHKDEFYQKLSPIIAFQKYQSRPKLKKWLEDGVWFKESGNMKFEITRKSRPPKYPG